MNRISKVLLAFLVIGALSVLFAAINPRQVDVTKSVKISGSRDAIWRAIEGVHGG